MAVNTFHHQQWSITTPWTDGLGIASHETELGILVDLVRPNVSKRLEEARAAKAIGHPYDAAITLSVRSKKIVSRSSAPGSSRRQASRISSTQPCICLPPCGPVPLSTRRRT